MRKDVRLELEKMSEENYKKFSSSLIPGVENMLGIRLPLLREYAKKLAKGDWEDAIEEEDYYFEEVMLKGMVIGYASFDIFMMEPYITGFIPLVDNWSVCDSVFMGMKIFEKNREWAWDFVQPYLRSNKEFEIRVGVIIMMQHILKCDENGKKMARLRRIDKSCLGDSSEKEGLYLDRIFEAMDRIDTSKYYASMAVSWLVTEAFCLFPYHTYEYLKKCKLDNVTYNKGLQKIVESKIPGDEVKRVIRGMKR